MPTLLALVARFIKPATLKAIAKDVVFYGGIAVGIFSVLANVPGLRDTFGTSGPAQAIADAAVGAATIVLSWLSQQRAKLAYRAGAQKKAMPK